MGRFPKSPSQDWLLWCRRDLREALIAAVTPEAGGYLQLFLGDRDFKEIAKRSAPLVTAVSRSWAPSDGPALPGKLPEAPRMRRFVADGAIMGIAQPRLAGFVRSQVRR